MTQDVPAADREFIANKMKEFDKRFKNLYLESKKLELINLLLRIQLDRLVTHRRQQQQQRPGNILSKYKQIQNFHHNAKLFVRLEKLGNKKLQNLTRGLHDYNKEVKEFYETHGIQT
ncbi:hypothetical protein Cantr_01415 [Candida viswanathii]|uniref:Uncharacterized protein n=1 Tax=Candida viswanathii TaxID=5486 RepID=A0A367YKI0_9ASCO|nr:hypothetical protein Cantr_01415 [Candida viswanathii]